MIRRTLLALMLTGVVVLGAATPAAAFPPPGDYLVVTAYFADWQKTRLVGQQWHGCGQPGGSWGVTSNIRTLHLTPC